MKLPEFSIIIHETNRNNNDEGLSPWTLESRVSLERVVYVSSGLQQLVTRECSRDKDPYTQIPVLSEEFLEIRFFGKVIRRLRDRVNLVSSAHSEYITTVYRVQLRTLTF